MENSFEIGQMGSKFSYHYPCKVARQYYKTFLCLNGIELRLSGSQSWAPSHGELTQHPTTRVELIYSKDGFLTIYIYKSTWLPNSIQSRCMVVVQWYSTSGVGGP